MPGNRRSIRLRDYDYACSGAYYVTVCVNDRKCMFGEICDGKMVLNECGKMVDKCWNEIPEHFPHVELDEYIIMPNHVHGIINIGYGVGANNYSPLIDDNHSPLSSMDRAKNFSPLRTSVIPRVNGTSKTIGSVVRGFKIGVTKWIRQNTGIKTVWQRNFYEHVIRNESDIARIREYIINNPIDWKTDEYYL